MLLSRLFFENLGNFFVDYIGHSAVIAGANIGEAICHNAVSRTEPIVCALKHSDIILRIPYTHQDLPSQLLLQISGRADLGDTLGMDVDDPGSGAEDFTEFSEFVAEQLLCFIQALLFFGLHIRVCLTDGVTYAQAYFMAEA